VKGIVSLCSKFNMEAFSTEYRLVTYRVLSDGAEERIDPVSNPVIVAIVSAIFGFLFGNISGWIAAKRDRRKLVVLQKFLSSSKMSEQLRQEQIFPHKTGTPFTRFTFIQL
jgi:hypothetical protein